MPTVDQLIENFAAAAASRPAMPPPPPMRTYGVFEQGRGGTVFATFKAKDERDAVQVANTWPNSGHRSRCHLEKFGNLGLCPAVWELLEDGTRRPVTDEAKTRVPLLADEAPPMRDPAKTSAPRKLAEGEKFGWPGW